MMKKSIAAATPDAYVAGLSGWQRDRVERLRKIVRASATLDEEVKWRHLVYFANGPVLLIRAEEHRVLFGFWRGQRLREIEPRLKPGGKYEMATMVMTEASVVDTPTVQRLVREAHALNLALGNPAVLSK